MSGPWENYKPTTAAPTPGLDSRVVLQPWEKYASGVAADAAPAPAPSAKDPKELQANVTTMLQNKVPLEQVQKYVTDSGYVIDPKTQSWLDENYAKYSAPDVPKQHYSVNVNGQQPQVNALSSWWHGVQSGALRGYDDELSALSNAVGGELGLNNNDAGGFWDRYDRALPQFRAQKDAAFQQHPVAYGFGFVPGSLTGPSYVRTPAGSTIGRVGQAAGTAGIEGVLSGSGNADEGAGNRLVGAGEGGLASLILGPLMYPFGVAGSHIVGRVAERLRPANGPNSLNSGLDVLASRAPQDATAMQARAAEMRAAGVDPRVVDVIDEGGRGVVRTAASKNTPARQDLAEHANTVYTDMQDRVANQARENISKAPKTARQYGEQIAEEQKALGPQFDAVRNQPVALTPEIERAFSTAEGRTVIRAIARYMTPSEQTALNDMVKAIHDKAKFGSIEDQAEKIMPGFKKLSPDAQRVVLPQLGLKEPAEPVLTVDIADKFARLINERAREVPGLQRVASDYANTVRGAARSQYKDYDNALNTFEAQANVGNAAQGTKQFEDSSFLNTHPDQYRPGEASATPAAIGDGNGATMSERDMLHVRARDEVADAATAGSGAGAPKVARQIAQGSAQHQRNVALLGEEGAARLEAGMRNEGRRLENTRFIDPRIGSKTAPMAEDAAAADETIHFAADAASHGHWGLVRGVSRWLRGAGIRGIDAERLTRDAISEDPARVNAAIEYLSKKGLDRSRASGLVRQLKRASLKIPGRVAGAAVSDPSQSPPPNSVQAIIREDRRQ